MGSGRCRRRDRPQTRQLTGVDDRFRTRDRFGLPRQKDDTVPPKGEIGFLSTRPRVRDGLLERRRVLRTDEVTSVRVVFGSRVGRLSAGESFHEGCVDK